MATQLFANNAASVLASSITNVATTLSVSAGHGARFPSPTGSDFFLATLCQQGSAGEINFEIVKVTARSTDTFTIVRAQEGTTGLAYNAGDKVELRITKGTMEGREAVSNKDASGGYPGLTLLKLNLRNAADTITSWFTTAATVARTWALPDKSGTVALVDDGTGVAAFGRNANNLGIGLQVGGGDTSYGADGTLLNMDGHASWLRMQPSKNESALEVLLYNSAAQGRATGTIGTSTITRISGTAFSSTWVGKKFYFGSAVYRVATYVDADNITVTNVLGGTIPFASTYNETFHVAYIQGTGSCTVTGGVVARTSGDPFIPFITSPYVFKLGSTTYTVTTFTDISTQTISSPPANGNYTYTWEVDINDQLTTLRVQKMLGTDEENLSIFARYDGYHFRSYYAGSGQMRPLFFGNSSFTNMVLYADGSTSLGSTQGGEALRILAPTGLPVNRIELQAALTTLIPTLRGRGTDTNVGVGVDTQGSGSFRVTSHSFGNIEFEVFGVGGSSWLAAQSDASAAPILSANGAASNIDIKLAPKGTGAVHIGAYTAGTQVHTGYITVKDSAGVTRRLLCV